LSNQAQMEHAMQAIRFAQQRLAEAESDIGFYRQQAATARLEGERGDVVGRAVSPARRLQELEMALSGFKARGFTDRHPDVITARAEIEQLRKRLAEGDEGPVPASLAEQEALAQAARAELRAEANRQELQRLQQVVAQAQERLAATPRVAEQLEALQREWYSLNESFQSFSAKRLEANVAANMERRQKGEQFRVLEAAFPPPAPTSPNRIVILLVGLFLAVAMGAGVGLLLEA